MSDLTGDAGRHRSEGYDAQEGTTSADGSYVGGAEETQAVDVTRSEERAHVGTETEEAGRVTVSKHVEAYPVEEVVPRRVEHADTNERVPALEGDSGEVETLEDGSVSIPVFEEVLVVTKRLVVRERVIVRKRTTIDEHTLQTELRRERVTVDGDVEGGQQVGTYGPGTTEGGTTGTTGTAGTTGTTGTTGTV